MIVFVLNTQDHSEQVEHNLNSFNLQSWLHGTIYSFICVQGVAVNGPEASNRFLSVKCRQWTGILLVG